MNIFESRMNELYKLVDYHAGLYYDENRSEISDSEYDALVRELLELERDYPQFARMDSRIHKVGGSPSSLFTPVRHDVPMLSLDNVYELDLPLTPIRKKLSKHKSKSLEGFFSEINQDKGFTCEMKIDGLTVSLIYEDGVFVQGSTRGDGHIGEDVTETLRLGGVVPQKLINAPSGHLEVQGEVFLTYERFKSIEKFCEERGEKLPKSLRNIAAGILKTPANDNDIVKVCGLDIFLYYLIDAERFGVTRQSEALSWLAEHGLPVQSAYSFCNTLDDVKDFILRWMNEKRKLNYKADGVVVKLDDLTQWGELGATTHAPLWAVAFKYDKIDPDFPKALTRLRDIVISIGRTGVLTPVAILDPVELQESTIQRATLNNADYIRQKDIRIGDAVWIYRAGDVIPKVDSVDKDERIQGKKRIMYPFIMPDKCPVCGGEIKQETREILSKRKGHMGEVLRKVTLIAQVCQNHKSCPAQLKERLRHFVSRKAMDIRGIGKELSYALVDSGKVKEITDIYRLTRDDWLSIKTDDRFIGEKVADKIIMEVEDSKSRPLASFITALGINNVERTVADKLAEYFKTIEALEKAAKNAAIEKIIDALDHKTGQAVLSLHDFFSHDENIDTIKKDFAEYQQDTLKAISASLMTIPNVSKHVARKLADYAKKQLKHFRLGELDAMRGITIDTIVKALELIVARSIYDYFRDNDNIKLINDFKALGLNFAGYDRASRPGRPRPKQQQPSEILDDRLKGQVFVFTGTLSSMTRNEAWAKVMELGGQISEHVSLKTSYLVAGEKTGSKLKRAQELGIAILSEQEFIDMLKKT